MTRKGPFWPGFLLFLFTAPLVAKEKPLALDPRAPLTSYARESWSADDGLPLNSLIGVAQAENGYLWITTEEGAVRFDGKAFRVFNATNTPEMKSSSVMAAVPLSDGRMAISNWSGVVIFDRSGARHYGEKEGLPSMEVYALAAAPNGVLWIGTGNGLARFEDGKITQTYGTKQGLPDSGITALARRDDDSLWVATAKGVVLFRGGRFTPPIQPKAFSDKRITSMIADGDRLWLARRGGGLQLLENGEVQEYTAKDGMGSDYVTSIMRASDGTMWIGTLGGGLVRFVDGKFERFSTADGLESDIVNTVLEDREGSIWFTTTGAGLHRLKMPKVRMVSKRDGLSTDAVIPVLEDREGTLWIGTAGMGLHRYKNGTMSRFPRDVLKGLYIFVIYESSDGAVWVATGQGVSRYQNGKFVHFTEKDHGVPGYVHAIHERGDGTLWIGGSTGLTQFIEGKFVPYSLGIPKESGIYSIEESVDGAMWFATRGSGIVRLGRDGKITRLTKNDGLYSNEFLSLSIDRNGVIWAPTMEHGVNRIAGRKVSGLTAAKGLVTDRIFHVVEDDFGDIWMSSNRGISRFSRAMLDEFDAGKISTLTPTLLGKADGLPNQECNGGFDNAIFKARDGRLYFPTMGGVAIIDPAKRLANTTPPSVELEAVLIDGEPLDDGGRIERFADKSNFEFRYTALSFYAPEATRFRYRLEGFDDEWIEAGTRRSAFYTHLPPGDYRFLVEAINSDGVSSTRAASVDLKLEPRFRQTKTFYALVVLAVLASITALVRARIGRLKDRESLLVQILQERERAEQAVRESERHFRTLIENGSDIIMVLDHAGSIVYASPSVEHLLGYSEREVENTLLCDHLHDDDAADALHALTRKVRNATSVATTFRFRHHDGTWRWLEAVARNVTFEQGKDEVVVNCRDISERTLLETQLQQANRLNSLGRLAATVAHEFNNVLMGIQPFAEILRRYSSHPRSSEAVDHIEKSVKRGRRVSEEILRYTRPSEPVIAPIPVHTWLGDVACEIQVLVGPGVQVDLSLPEERLVVDGDVQQLNQVLTNLALNARDAMSGSGTVEISVRACGQQDRFHFGAIPESQKFVQLTVRDTGSGIPGEVLPHIFEPLFTTKKRGGTGLGLAVAHQVVQRHGGEVFVESKVGVGTAFHIFLPRSAAAASTVTIDQAMATSRQLVLSRVVLVEDDHSVATGIVAILEMEGIDVLSVARGADVVDAITREKPDAVILDLDLPDTDGVSVYQKIASRWPSLPVVFSTGNGDESKLERFLLNGHVAFLQKPYEAEQLLTTLRAVAAGPLPLATRDGAIASIPVSESVS